MKFADLENINYLTNINKWCLYVLKIEIIFFVNKIYLLPKEKHWMVNTLAHLYPPLDLVRWNWIVLEGKFRS